MHEDKRGKTKKKKENNLCNKFVNDCDDDIDENDDDMLKKNGFGK